MGSLNARLSQEDFHMPDAILPGQVFGFHRLLSRGGTHLNDLLEKGRHGTPPDASIGPVGST